MIQFAKASALIFASAIALHTAGFQRTINLIERLGRGRLRPAADSVRAIRRARSYGLFRGNCLSQSLALLWLLRRSGHDGALRVGVKPVAGRLLSHAWVELDGETIDPAAISCDYAQLTRSRGAAESNHHS